MESSRQSSITIEIMGIKKKKRKDKKENIDKNNENENNDNENNENDYDNNMENESDLAILQFIFATS